MYALSKWHLIHGTPLSGYIFLTHFGREEWVALQHWASQFTWQCSPACGADFLSPFFFAHKRRKVLPYDLLQREDHRRRSWGEMIQVALFLALFHRLLDILLSMFNFLWISEYMVVFPSTDIEIKHFILRTAFLLFLFCFVFVRVCYVDERF